VTDDPQEGVRASPPHGRHDLGRQPAGRVAVGEVGEGTGEEQRVFFLGGRIEGGGQDHPVGVDAQPRAEVGGARADRGSVALGEDLDEVEVAPSAWQEGVPAPPVALVQGRRRAVAQAGGAAVGGRRPHRLVLGQHGRQ